jgi:hypothetical protein
MGKKKTKQETKNTYNYMTPPSTPDTSAYREQIAKSYDTPDPSIPYAFSNARNQIKDRFSNPFGADYSSEVQDAAKYAGNSALDQAQGQAMREDQFNRANAKVSAQGGLAGLTAPNLVQTGGTQVLTKPGFGWGDALGMGASVGTALL